MFAPRTVKSQASAGRGGTTANTLAVSGIPLQRKLKVGDAHDPAEAEADRIADRVMRTPDPDVSIAHSVSQLSRKCAGCEDEDHSIQPKASPDHSPETGDAPAVVHDALSTPGKPLDLDTRHFMEGRFGRDFSRVRIHADASSTKAVEAVNARAFAAGSHIVVDPAECRGDRGRQLIAHELVHTMQQRGSIREGVIRRQSRAGLRVALPKNEIKAIGNPDINQIIDAFPTTIVNGQTFNIAIASPDGTVRSFGIEITIKPGPPPVTGTSEARTKKKPASPSSKAPPIFSIEIFQVLSDPVRTLFHEFLHLRLGIDRELPEDQRSQTFERYGVQFQMVTDEAVLRATGTFALKTAVMDKVAAVRNWFQTFVAGFKIPAELSAAKDEEFLQHFIEEKFANQEAAAAKISPGRGRPSVTSPITTATIARRYASTVADLFRQVADAQGLQGTVAAAEARAKASASLPSLDDLNAQLAAALQRLFDALDAQLAQIAAFKQRTDLPKSAKELSPREMVDELQTNEPPLRLR